MTFDEALAELGIAADAGPDHARRAYLRLLKTRKPEVDPQGFMRLREAYDLVKGELAMREVFLRIFTEARPLEVDASEPGGGEPDPPPPPAEPAEEDHDAGGGELEPPPPTPAEPAVDDVAGDRGAPAEEPPSVEAVQALLDAELYVPAAHELGRRLDAAALDARVGAPSIHITLRILLALHAEGELEAARALHSRVRSWLHRSGQEARVIRGEAAAVWAVACELDTLPADLPKEMREIMARAASDGELGQAVVPLAFMQMERPTQAREVARALRTHAPVLAGAFAGALEGGLKPASEPAPQRTSRWSGWVIAVIIMAVLRLVMVVGKSSPPTPVDTSRFTPRVDVQPYLRLADGGMPGRIPMPPSLQQRAVARAHRLKAHADYQLADAGDRADNLERVSAHADRIASALERGDCVTASARTAIVRAYYTSDAGTVGDAIGRDEALVLEQAVNTYCASITDPPGPTRRP